MILAATGGVIRNAYLDGAFGQLHLRYVAPAEGARVHRPCLFFAASSNSALLYGELLREMGRDRLAFAFDTPGYGESTAPPEPVADIAVFADAFAAALPLLTDQPVDVFGHHSGALLSLALAAFHPARVAHVLVAGVPFATDPARRAALQSRYPDFPDAATAQTYLARNWKYWVDDRPADLGFARAVSLFTDSLCAGVRMNALYRCIYGEGTGTWLPRVTAPVRYLQIEDSLSPNSLLAAALTSNSTVKDRPDLHHMSFITRPADFAAELRAAFD